MLNNLGDGNCFSGPLDRIHVQEAQQTEGTVNLGQSPQERKEEKMKKMKKFFAMFLTLAMVLGMSVTTFAASAGTDGKVGTNDDKGTITVSGIAGNTGTTPVSVTAYQIIKATYGNEGKTFTGYEVVDKYKTALSAVNTEADVNLSIEQVNAVVAAGFADVTPYVMSNTDVAPTVYTAEVPVGTYIVMIENADTVIYSPVIVSVAYKAENGGNAFDEGSVNVIDDGNAWVKESSQPTVDKKAKANATAADEVHSVNIGDTVYYDVEINPVPYYNGASPVLNIVDTLSRGLTLNVDSVAVTTAAGNALAKGTDYTVVYDEITQTLTVDFVVNGSYMLNDLQGSKVTVSYNAVVNDSAVINENANNNDVTLNFTRDSNTTGNDGTGNDKTYTYTFDVGGAVQGSVTEGMLTKTGELNTTTSSTALPGAVFNLYTDLECTTRYQQGGVDYADVVSGADGSLAIKGLKEGVYYLKETTAPTGYSLNEHAFKIEIDADYDNDGKLTNWTVKIDDKEGAFQVNNGTVTPTKELEVEIPNTKLTTLPSTGGIGTTVFTIGGCAIMIIAAGLYFSLRRKTAK